MLHLNFRSLCLTLAVLSSAHFTQAAEGLRAIELPPAQTVGGKPLMEALLARHTSREFSSQALSPQILANLLWAAFGENRSTGQRTAPSAMNSQEVEIYAALPQGLFVYDAKGHRLNPVLAADIRDKAGGQDSFRVAPVTLIYVANLPKLAKATPETRPFYAGFDAGCICQNVYLYCASTGLATVVHDLDRGRLAPAMTLKSEQQIILAQAVGMPREAN
jgi:hypothetical protein